MNPSITLFIGIDAGGTKTHLLARRSDQSLPSELILPGLNLQRDGQESALALLASGIKEATAITENGPHKPDGLSICAGIAGAGLEADRQVLSDLLMKSIQAIGFSQCHLSLLTDAAIAFHAAHADQPGLMIIAGTGSILWAKAPDGKLHRSGGWGYLLGDEGGGYRIGLAGLKAVANMMDGGPATQLKEVFCSHFQLCSPHALRTFVYAHLEPLQQLAPLVLDTAANGDTVALQILTHQTLALTAQLKWLIQSAPPFPLDTVLIGGLTKHVFYRELLIKTLHQQYPALTFYPPKCKPAEAALELATHL